MADENTLKSKRWRKIHNHLDTVYQAELVKLRSMDQRLHALASRRDDLARIMDSDTLNCAFRSRMLNRYLSGVVEDLRRLQQQRDRQAADLQRRKAAADKAEERAEVLARAARQKQPAWEPTTLKASKGPT